jgi:multiple sugar transport system substrate-binding protein
MRKTVRLPNLLFVLVVIATLILTSGSIVTAQDTDLTAGVSNKFAGKEVRLIMANHPWNNAIQALIPQFEKASGISLRIESYFEDQLSQKLQIGLTSGTSQADAFMFRPLQEGKLFAKNGWVADLSTFAQNEKDWNWSDFQEAARNTVTFDKVLYGIPIVTEREMIYYRKDLFEKAGLKPPATLDELKAAAEKLTESANGVFGVVMRGQRSPSVTQFSSFLYSFGGTWIKDGKSALDSPEALAAYKFYGDLLRSYGPPGTLNMSWPQALALFQQGKVGMWIDADVFYSNVIDATKSTVVDKVGFAPFPEGPAGANNYNVTSWAVGLNANSPNKDAAWEFVKWATSAPVVLNLQQKGVPGARASVWESPEGLKGFPEDYAKVVQTQVKRGVGFDRPQVIKVGQARDIVGNPIVISIQGGDVEAAVKEAHQQFNAFLEQDK